MNRVEKWNDKANSDYVYSGRTYSTRYDHGIQKQHEINILDVTNMAHYPSSHENLYQW